MVIIIIIIIYLSHTDAASINFRIAVVILGTWRKKMWQRLIDWLIQCCESRFPTRIRPQNYAKTVIKTKKCNLSYVKMRTFFVKISSYLFVWFSSQVQVRFLKFVLDFNEIEIHIYYWSELLCVPQPLTLLNPIVEFHFLILVHIRSVLAEVLGHHTLERVTKLQPSDSLLSIWD